MLSSTESIQNCRVRVSYCLVTVVSRIKCLNGVPRTLCIVLIRGKPGLSPCIGGCLSQGPSKSLSDVVDGRK